MTTEKIASIQKKLDEQRALLDQLRMWDEVKLQGINPDDVAAFTFREDFLSPNDKRALGMVRQHCKPDPYVSPDGRVKVFNAVRLNDGSYQRLSSHIRRPIEA